MGICGPHLRRPLTEMEEANAERLKKAMIDVGILRSEKFMTKV